MTPCRLMPIGYVALSPFTRKVVNVPSAVRMKPRGPDAVNIPVIVPLSLMAAGSVYVAPGTSKVIVVAACAGAPAARSEKATTRGGEPLRKRASGMIQFLRVVDMGIRVPGWEGLSGKNSTARRNV